MGDCVLRPDCKSQPTYLPCRLIDTAEYYGNEADVGTAVKSCGIPRDEIFVVTKLWDHGYDTCMRHFSDSFKKLDIGSVTEL